MSTDLRGDGSGSRALRYAIPKMLLLAGANILLYGGASYGVYPESLLAPAMTVTDCVILLVAFRWALVTVDQEREVRMQAAAELAEAMSLAVTVSDSTADPILVQNRDGLLVLANAPMLHLLGKTRDEATHCVVRELFEGIADANQSELENNRVMAERIPATIEQSLRMPQGLRTFVTTKSPWLGSDGTVLGMISVSTDISERKQAEETQRTHELKVEEIISHRTADLRRLAYHLESVREEEKRAIARELHDDMGSSLTSLSMHMEGAYPLLPGDAQWTERKAKIKTLLRSLVTTTRRIQTELRPTMLDLFGIKAAINELTDDFRQSSHIACEVSVPDEEIAINHRLEITLYRMLQEMLNNVVKHAHASTVDVILDVDEDQVALTVRDNGVGMQSRPDDRPGGFGLRGLQERAAFLGGSVSVAAGRSGGTVVSVRLPLSNDEMDPVGL